jgi:hypothetical protein
MRKIVSSLAIAAFLTACSGSDAPPPPPPSGAIRAFNDSSLYVIDELYVAPSPAPPWGDNRTASTIPRTWSLTVDGLAPGYWDVMAVSYDAYSPYSPYYTYTLDQLVVADTTLDVSMSDPFTGSLDVTNGNGTHALIGLWVVPHGYGSWGQNWLTTSIGPGSYFLLTNLSPGSYDFQCEHDDIVYSSATVSIGSHATTSISCN